MSEALLHTKEIWTRMTNGMARFGAVLALVLAPGLVRAEGPAFDCDKADGTVEKMICTDTGLSALDRELDGVYKAALAKARDDVPRFLRTEQRGWIKGRNECWKAEGGSPVYLTASWTAASVHDCVEGQYRLRISELQALMRLVPEKRLAFFACEGNPANEIVATFFETDPPTARIERGDRTVTAWLVPTGSGAKYEGQNVEFWNKGKDAMVTWNGDKMTCTTR
jgi:uncharacterized protein